MATSIVDDPLNNTMNLMFDEMCLILCNHQFCRKPDLDLPDLDLPLLKG